MVFLEQTLTMMYQIVHLKLMDIRVNLERIMSSKIGRGGIIVNAKNKIDIKHRTYLETYRN